MIDRSFGCLRNSGNREKPIGRTDVHESSLLPATITRQ